MHHVGNIRAQHASRQRSAHGMARVCTPDVPRGVRREERREAADPCTRRDFLRGRPLPRPVEPADFRRQIACTKQERALHVGTQHTQRVRARVDGGCSGHRPDTFRLIDAIERKGVQLAAATASFSGPPPVAAAGSGRGTEKVRMSVCAWISQHKRGARIFPRKTLHATPPCSHQRSNDIQMHISR